MKADDPWQRLQSEKIVNKNPLEKKLKQITDVIKDPDVYNVNIASRERLDQMELRLKKLEQVAHEPQDYRKKCEQMQIRIDKLEELLNVTIQREKRKEE